MSTTNFTFHATARTRSAPYLKRNLQRSLTHIRKPPAEVAFALVGDLTMARLHKRYLGIDGPTDVLTFPLEHDAQGAVMVGQIVVCVPKARRNANRHGTRVDHELLLYCLHGLLHLTGYDDLDDASYLKMHRAEDRILTSIGIGPVFDTRSHTKKVGRRA